MIKAVWREEWSEAHELRDELEEAGLKPPHVREVSTERENTVRELRKFIKVTRGTTQGKQHTENLLQSGGKSAAAQERKLQAATKREINADPPPCAPTNGRPGFPFGFLGAGGRLPKARRGQVFIVQFFFFF